MKRVILWKMIVIYLGIVSTLSAQQKYDQADKQAPANNLKPTVKALPSFPSLDAIVEVENPKNDSQKKQLIDSLSRLKDIIIYDIDYNDEVAIAVGEDNSIETRKAYSQDEYHKALTLYSFDNGKSWNPTYGDEIPFHSVKLIKGKKAVACGMMEGSGGIIALTEDGGKK